MPTRQTERLHAFRHSASGARYFITCCTAGRQTGLVNPAIHHAVFNEVQPSDQQEDTTTLAFVLMPDHLHGLFSPGGPCGPLYGKPPLCASVARPIVPPAVAKVRADP